MNAGKGGAGWGGEEVEEVKGRGEEEEEVKRGEEEKKNGEAGGRGVVERD